MATESEAPQLVSATNQLKLKAPSWLVSLTN